MLARLLFLVTMAFAAWGAIAPQAAVAAVLHAGTRPVAHATVTPVASRPLGDDAACPKGDDDACCRPTPAPRVELPACCRRPDGSACPMMGGQEGHAGATFCACTCRSAPVALAPPTKVPPATLALAPTWRLGSNDGHALGGAEVPSARAARPPTPPPEALV